MIDTYDSSIYIYVAQITGSSNVNRETATDALNALIKTDTEGQPDSMLSYSVHPNDSGYNWMAGKWAAAINAN